MIQRIQTLILVVIVILNTILPFTTYAELFVPNDFTYGISTISVSKIMPAEFINFNWTLIVLNILLIIIPITTIINYKRRLLQIRLLVVNIIISTGTIFAMWFQIRSLDKTIGLDPIYNISMVFPIITIILSILAIHWIIKDIKLLKSVDRIR